MYAQMVYKDRKIMELNNKVLEMDRRVMDLQELVGEKQEVIRGRDRVVEVSQFLDHDIDTVEKSGGQCGRCVQIASDCTSYQFHSAMINNLTYQSDDRIGS